MGDFRRGILLTPKRSGESDAPDEFSAIEQVAFAVAGALDALVLGDLTRTDALVEGIRLIRESLVDIGDRLRRLEARSEGVDVPS